MTLARRLSPAVGDDIETDDDDDVEVSFGEIPWTREPLERGECRPL